MEFEPRHLQTLRGKPGKSTENVSYFFLRGVPICTFGWVLNGLIVKTVNNGRGASYIKINLR